VFSSISITNFRCFKHISLKPLTRINLIAGKNNVGKTALLEAIFILIGSQNLDFITRISNLRGIRDFGGDLKSNLELLWASLFHNFHLKSKINIVGKLPENKNHSLEMFLSPKSNKKYSLKGDSTNDSFFHSNMENLANQVLMQKYIDPENNTSSYSMKVIDDEYMLEPTPESPLFPSFFIPANVIYNIKQDANLFGRLEISKSTFINRILEILQDLDVRLRQFKIITSSGSPLIYCDIGLDQMIPISLMGAGMGRLLSILLKIANAAGGIVLIDEIENGLHYSIHPNIWKIISKAADSFDVQVFATTHSYECIHAAYEAFTGNGSKDLS
jgi:AAA15 family ATPase/GTPase